MEGAMRMGGTIQNCLVALHRTHRRLENHIRVGMYLDKVLLAEADHHHYRYQTRALNHYERV